MANRAAFYDAVRGSLFGGRLTESQVKGMEALFASCARHNVKSLHHIAYIMANVFHETGGHMLPIKETVMPHHKDKNPSDAVVIGRLDRAFAKGQLPWVKTPYWRDGWFGRGPIQITHRANYEKLGKRIGVDLVKNRVLALDPNIGAEIAVVGMVEGHFTGKKLAAYDFPTALNAAPAKNPRRIVNGQDGTDEKIAGYHRAFFAALQANGGTGTVTQPSKPSPAPSAPNELTKPASAPLWLVLAIVFAAAAAFVIFNL